MWGVLMPFSAAWRRQRIDSTLPGDRARLAWASLAVSLPHSSSQSYRSALSRGRSLLSGRLGLSEPTAGVVATLVNQANGRMKRLGMVMDGILWCGLSLHAQIALPAASRRTAAITVDRCEHARQPVDEAAWNPVHAAVAAGACAASVNGTRCRLRPTLAGGQVRLDAPGHPPTRSPVACEKLTRRFAIANVHPP